MAVLDVNPSKLAVASGLLGESALALEVDVSSPEAVRKAVAHVVSQTGRVDVLVNCAGITGQTNIKSHEVDLADFDRVFALNVRASLVTFQTVVPHMLERGYGRVLHIASIAGKEGNAGMLAYSASKAAVIGMTKVQGKEYAGTGVSINALALIRGVSESLAGRVWLLALDPLTPSLIDNRSVSAPKGCPMMKAPFRMDRAR